MLGQCGGVVGLLDLGDVQSNKCSLEHALSMYPTSMTCMIRLDFICWILPGRGW